MQSSSKRIIFLTNLLGFYLMGCGFPDAPITTTHHALTTASSHHAAQWMQQTPRQRLDLTAPSIRTYQLKASLLQQLHLSLQRIGTTSADHTNHFAIHTQPLLRPTGRYLRFQVSWRQQLYDVSTDLASATFQLSIQPLRFPLRLECVPSSQQKNLSLAHKLPQAEKVTHHTTPSEPDDITRFQNDVLALARVLWNPMKRLWRWGRCATKRSCDSTQFSDITLDMHDGTNTPACQFTLLEQPAQAP